MHPIPQAFTHAAPEVRQLLQERSLFWEYYLTIHLLEEIFGNVRKQLDLLNEGYVTRPSEYIDADEKGMQTLMLMVGNIQRLFDSLGPVFKQLMRSWKSEDPWPIRQSCRLFMPIVNDIVSWERRFKSLVYPDTLAPVMAQLNGLAEKLFVSFEVLPGVMSEHVEQQKEASESGKKIRSKRVTITIDLVFDPRIHLLEFNKAMNRVVRDYKNAHRPKGFFESLFDW